MVKIKGLAICSNPKYLFYKLHNYLFTKTSFYNHKKFKTKVGKNCSISRKAFISETNVIIGDNVIVEENVIVRNNVTIEENVIIRAGSIIGGEGFQIISNNEKNFSVSHAGGVIIKSNVEIQYLTTIDKGIFKDNTILDSYTKVDNQVQIAHGTKIGKRCLLASNSMISGNVVLEDDIWVGPSSVISSSVRIGAKSYISIGSVVANNIKPGSRVSGNFAINHNKFLINHAKSIRV